MQSRGVTLGAAWCLLAALLVGPSGVAGAHARLRALAQSRAHFVGEMRGENSAALQFYTEWLGMFPKNATKAQKQAVIKSLESEVSKLSLNVETLKNASKAEKLNVKNHTEFEKHLKGADAAMMEKMDDWSARSNEKARVSAMNVLSKLKNVIHLVKKGALSGDASAADKLNDVMKQMSQMAR